MRRQYHLVQAIQDAPQPLSRQYFLAVYDDPEEAAAMFNIYQSRNDQEPVSDG